MLTALDNVPDLVGGTRRGVIASSSSTPCYIQRGQLQVIPVHEGIPLFLALREIRHEPTRFVLIVVVIVLVSYLTFFLAALAGGLAHSYRSAIDHWDASSAVLTDASNNNISASQLTQEQLDVVTAADPGAEALVISAVVADGGSGEKTDISAFGVVSGSFLAPTVTEGASPTDATNQVIADSALKDDGWALGQTFTLSGSTQQWEVIGFTSDRSFQATPVVFFDQDALVTSSASGVSTAPNVAVSRTDLTADASLTAVGLQALSLSELISELPGYSAQVLTFSLMIVSLIAISSFVLGIFVYVLTLQKRSVLGVLKARGVSTRYLIASGAAQTGLLAAGGVLIGLALTVGTSLFLPGAVPFRSDGVTDGVIGVAFMVFSLIGGVISVRVIARIDPVEAIA